MIKSQNINLQKVHEMSEGDMAFEKELLTAISNSVMDLKKKYAEGLELKDEEMLHQARHKIKPTLAIFELNSLMEILQRGKALIEVCGFEENIDQHQQEFMKAIDDLLRDLDEIIH